MTNRLSGFLEMVEGAFGDLRKIFDSFMNGDIPLDDELYIYKAFGPAQLPPEQELQSEGPEIIEGEFKRVE